MNDRDILKKTIQWTFYVVIVLVIIFGYFFPFAIFILSKNPPSKIIDWLNYAGVGLSIFSLGLALYSLLASIKSQEKIELSMSNLQDIYNNIKNSQDRIESRLDSITNLRNSNDGTDTSAWKQDKTGPKE